MTRWFRGRLLLWGGAAAILAVDQLVKAWVVATLPFGVPVAYFAWLKPVLSFTYITNTGVAFGLFPQLGDFFTILALVVVAAMVFFQRSIPPDDWLLHIALGFQVGGALGNLADRLFRGSVVDFLDFNFWPLQNWAVFNLADAAIVSGVSLLVLISLLRPEEETPADART